MPATWIFNESEATSSKASLLRSALCSLRYIPIALIVVYQRFISPLLPPSCRFYPTCSTYACHALYKYGIIKGGFLTVVRILKCHPLHPGGYDPLE